MHAHTVFVVSSSFDDRNSNNIKNSMDMRKERKKNMNSKPEWQLHLRKKDFCSCNKFMCRWNNTDHRNKPIRHRSTYISIQCFAFVILLILSIFFFQLMKIWRKKTDEKIKMTKKNRQKLKRKMLVDISNASKTIMLTVSSLYMYHIQWWIDIFFLFVRDDGAALTENTTKMMTILIPAAAASTPPIDALRMPKMPIFLWLLLALVCGYVNLFPLRQCTHIIEFFVQQNTKSKCKSITKSTQILHLYIHRSFSLSLPLPLPLQVYIYI